MTTLAQFRSTIRLSGNFAPNDTRITDAVIDLEINRALKRIAMLHDWPWLQAERLLITTDQRTIALPADFLRLISLRYEDGGSNLSQRSVQEVDLLPGTASPAVFSIWAGKIVFGPTPAGGDRLRLRYIVQETPLVNDSDEPLIPDYWNDGVVEGALVECYRTAMRLDEAGLAEARFQTWVKETQDNANQSRQPVRIRVRPGSLI